MTKSEDTTVEKTELRKMDLTNLHNPGTQAADHVSSEEGSFVGELEGSADNCPPGGPPAGSRGGRGQGKGEGREEGGCEEVWDGGGEEGDMGRVS